MHTRQVKTVLACTIAVVCRNVFAQNRLRPWSTRSASHPEIAPSAPEESSDMPDIDYSNVSIDRSQLMGNLKANHKYSIAPSAPEELPGTHPPEHSSTNPNANSNTTPNANPNNLNANSTTTSNANMSSAPYYQLYFLKSTHTMSVKLTACPSAAELQEFRHAGADLCRSKVAEALTACCAQSSAATGKTSAAPETYARAYSAIVEGPGACSADESARCSEFVLALLGALAAVPDSTVDVLCVCSFPDSPAPEAAGARCLAQFAPLHDLASLLPSPLKVRRLVADTVGSVLFYHITQGVCVDEEKETPRVPGVQITQVPCVRLGEYPPRSAWRTAALQARGVGMIDLGSTVQVGSSQTKEASSPGVVVRNKLVVAGPGTLLAVGRAIVESEGAHASRGRRRAPECEIKTLRVFWGAARSAKEIAAGVEASVSWALHNCSSVERIEVVLSSKSSTDTCNEALAAASQKIALSPMKFACARKGFLIDIRRKGINTPYVYAWAKGHGPSAFKPPFQISVPKERLRTERGIESVLKQVQTIGEKYNVAGAVALLSHMKALTSAASKRPKHFAPFWTTIRQADSVVILPSGCFADHELARLWRLGAPLQIPQPPFVSSSEAPGSADSEWHEFYPTVDLEHPHQQDPRFSEFVGVATKHQRRLQPFE